MRKTSLLALAAASAIAGLAGTAQAAPTVVELTQTACQFVEVEGMDHGYTSTGADDCNEINDDSGDERLAQSRTLRLSSR